MSEKQNLPQPIPVKLPRGAFYLVLAVVFVVVIVATTLRSPSRSQENEWTLTQVAEAAKAGRISQILITDTDAMVVTLKDGSEVYSTKDPSSSGIEQLAALGVSQDQLSAIDWKSEGDKWNTVLTAFLYLLPLVVVGGFLYWLLRHAVKYTPKV